MQQVWISRIGDPEVLELRQTPDPEPGPGEVRIRVAAAGVNFADVMARMGLYPDAPPLPAVVGYEVAGEIDAVGEGVPEDRLGEPVVALTRFGGYTTHRVVPAEHAVQRPEGLDAVTAASIPVTGLTAYMMLEVMGRVREGDRVLVHSAGGGVGLMALDLLKWRGAVAIGTASPHKHDFLAERGYEQVLDYTSPGWEAPLLEAPSLDLVLDPIGGASWRTGLAALRPGGRLVCFGFSSHAVGHRRNLFRTVRQLASVPWAQVNPISLMNHNKGVMGVNMGRMWSEGARVSGWLAALLDLWKDGVLRPLVHAEVPFSRAAEAHQILHDRKNLGKLVLVPDDVGAR